MTLLDEACRVNPVVANERLQVNILLVKIQSTVTDTWTFLSSSSLPPILSILNFSTHRLRER